MQYDCDETNVQRLLLLLLLLLPLVVMRSSLGLLPLSAALPPRCWPCPHQAHQGQRFTCHVTSPLAPSSRPGPCNSAPVPAPVLQDLLGLQIPGIPAAACHPPHTSRSRRTTAAASALPTAAGDDSQHHLDGPSLSPSLSPSPSPSPSLSPSPGPSLSPSLGPSPSLGSHASQWDRTTDSLVAAASVPFSVLVLPQVFQNLLNILHGSSAALSIISWEGYVSGLLGNTLMCTHFASRGERSAVNIQLIGMASNTAILTQVALAGFMPVPVFAAAVALSSVAAVLNTGRLQGRGLESLQDMATAAEQAAAGDPDGSGWSVWKLWQLVCGTLGLAVVPQVLANIFAPGQLGPYPGIATLLMLIASYLYLQTGGPAKRQSHFQLIAQLPGWGATLLFALSPLPQLVRNFLEPQSLQGLSVATMLLSLLGNTMMLPRALFTADPVWIAGTCWGCSAGWGQVLSMFLGTAAASGQRYLAAGPFAGVTVALLVFVAYTLVMDAKSKAATRAGPMGM